ncbi:MFS transporter, partial [Candidatus Woesearchaeota archaeon]|nr:MFS transporter [Candidatus Woesearchaeota archaeon]
MALRHNIRLMYVISCLMWGRFFVPVLALFYIASQVPLEQFAIIMSVFSLSTLLLEVPTGVMADLLGKKKTLLISRFLYIIEIYVIAFYNGFWPFLIAKIISGIGVSLSSGTSEALLYDTLKRLKRTDEHKNISSTQFALTNVSMAATFITGGWLFSIDAKLPALASLPIITLGFILTFFLKEPYKPRGSLTIMHAWEHMKEAMCCVMHHPTVRYLVLFSLPIATGISILLNLSSVYFATIGVPKAGIGLVAFVASLTTAAVARIAPRVEQRLGDHNTLFVMQTLLVAGTLLMAALVPLTGVLFYFAVPVVSGLFNVLINHYMNAHISTSHRATIISIQHLISNLGIVIVFPIVGAIIKAESFQTGLLTLAIFLVAYMLILSVVKNR